MICAMSGKKKIPIGLGNTFAKCPMCGVLHPVDLPDLIMQTDGDLENVQVYCERCTEKRALARSGANRGKEVQTNE